MMGTGQVTDMENLSADFFIACLDSAGVRVCYKYRLEKIRVRWF